MSINEAYESIHKKPFNDDKYMAEEFIRLRDLYSIKNAVETGSCIFSTTRWLGENFEKVYTFEHNTGFYEENFYKISDMPNVKAFNTRSVSGLSQIIDSLTEPTIFYLDAHWEDDCPINEEIEVISRCKAPHVIAIHDFKTNNPEMGFDSFPALGGYDLDLNLIYNELEKIYPYCIKFFYNKKAEGPKRGVIYILPQ